MRRAFVVVLALAAAACEDNQDEMYSSFNKMDVNHDQKVTRTEWYSAEPGDNLCDATNAGPFCSFENFDTNSDDFIDGGDIN